MSRGPSKIVLLLFALAVVIIGLLGPGALWAWGYDGCVLPLVVCLPVVWVIEFALYTLVSRRSALGILPGLGLGLAGRAAMAALAALWAQGPNAFAQGFLRYYGEFWLGALLQIAMATMLLWLLADLVPAVQELTATEASKLRRSRRRRRRLLDELLEGESAAPSLEAEEEEDEEDEEDEAGEEEAAPAEPEVVAEVAEEPAPEAEAAPVEEPVAVSEPEAVPEPLPSEALSATPAESSIGYGATDEVMRMAVIEAARQASGVEDLRALAGPTPDFPQIIGNPPREADAVSVAALAFRAAAATAALTDAAMLGAPTMAALLPKAGGILLVAAQGAVVCVRSPVSQAVGLFVAQGRKTASALQAPWTGPAGIDLDLSIVAEAAPACQALVTAVAPSGNALTWHDLGHLGVVALVASAGADHLRAAAAMEALWRVAADLSRQCNHSTLRRILLCGERGSAAAAPVRIGDGGFLLARLAPGAQPGMVMAELESLVAACQPEGSD